jgi:hypothetical protein
VLTGNALAAAAMLAYFHRGHRPAWRAFMTARP